MGDLSANAEEAEAVCAVFDLQGFTNFCRQVDPHLAIPEFMSTFLDWLFASIRKHWIADEPDGATLVDGVVTWTELPFFAKFMGDGVIFLWDTGGLSQVEICNIASLMMTICDDYRAEFLPKSRTRVALPPPSLRCGVARGKVFSVGNGQDYVGPCINVAARLQKLGGLGFAVARRGFDAEQFMSEETRERLALKRVTIRGIGDGELVWVDRCEFEELEPADKALFDEP